VFISRSHFALANEFRRKIRKLSPQRKQNSVSLKLHCHVGSVFASCPSITFVPVATVSLLIVFRACEYFILRQAKFSPRSRFAGNFLRAREHLIQLLPTVKFSPLFTNVLFPYLFVQCFSMNQLPNASDFIVAKVKFLCLLNSFLVHFIAVQVFFSLALALILFLLARASSILSFGFVDAPLHFSSHEGSILFFSQWLCSFRGGALFFSCWLRAKSFFALSNND
jgi:hypothetical protein